MAETPRRSGPFSVTTADMRDMARVRLRQPWWWLWAYGAALILPFAAAFFLMQRLATVIDPLVALAAPLVVLAVCIFVARSFYQRALLNWSLHKAGEATTTPRTVAIDETGLTVNTEQSRSWIGWRAIVAIKRGKRGVYYFLQPNNALPLADSAFDSSEARDAFHAEAKEFWERAKSQTP